MKIFPDSQHGRRTLPDGSYVIPVVISFDSRARKVMRTRTEEDDLADEALPKEQRPTRRARMMANALFLEGLLESGHFESPHELSRKCGIRTDTIYECLSLLNRPPAEIEAILFETC